MTYKDYCDYRNLQKEIFKTKSILESLKIKKGRIKTLLLVNKIKLRTLKRFVNVCENLTGGEN